MTNTAEIINFEQAQEQKKVVKADIDTGYDRLAHHLTDALANPPVKLSAREYQLIMCLVSKTYRYHKKSDWVSASQLSDLTGIDQTNVGKIKRSLIAKNILICDGKYLGINPIISDWGAPETSQKQRETSQKRLAENQSKTTSDQSKMTRRQSKTTKKLVKNDPHNKKTTITKETINKKENIQKKINALPLPDYLPRELWHAFVEHRLLMKNPLTEVAATRMLKRVMTFHQQGYDVVECINKAISRGWLGIWEPKPSRQPAKSEQFSQKNYTPSTFTGIK